MTQTTETRRDSLFAQTSTETLVVSALTLDGIEKPSQDERLALAWTLDEIERRHPEITAALEAWVEAAEVDGPSYAEVAVASLADLGAT